MIKVTIQHKGKSIPVEIDEDIAFGKLQSVLGTVSASSLDKFDLMNFMKGLTVAVVGESELDTSSKESLDKLPAKTAMALLKEVGKLYPLKDYMQEVAEMLGEKGKTTALQKDSTHHVP